MKAASGSAEAAVPRAGARGTIRIGIAPQCYVVGMPSGHAMETSMTHERIEINAEIMGGKPVIRGTRVPVEIVLRKLGTGMTAEAIVGDHPRLTLKDIRAPQAFADYLAGKAVVYG
jgi:uncharacterized protein (DUF433 family)